MNLTEKQKENFTTFDYDEVLKKASKLSKMIFDSFNIPSRRQHRIPIALQSISLTLHAMHNNL